MNWPLEDCCFAQLIRILKQLTLFLSLSELVGLSSNFCNPQGGFKAFLSSCWVNRSNTQMNESESKGIFIIRLFGPKKTLTKNWCELCAHLSHLWILRLIIMYPRDNNEWFWNCIVLRTGCYARSWLNPQLAFHQDTVTCFLFWSFQKIPIISKCVAEEHFCHLRTRILTLSFPI